MIVIFDTSPELKYFSKVDILIFFVPLNPLPFPIYEKIINIEMIKRKKEHLTFSFDLQIKDLKNFTNLISQIKQSNLRFKIIRHKQKKNAFIRRIFENFKRN